MECILSVFPELLSQSCKQECEKQSLQTFWSGMRPGDAVVISPRLHLISNISAHQLLQYVFKIKDVSLIG
jgi:hypothetical protein